MLLLDDNTPTLLAAAAAQTPDSVVPKDEFGQMIHTQDSISTAIKDSLKNMDLTDIKAVVTGENTLIKDGLRSLTELTVGFVPKLLMAILILWLGMKLAKMLKKVIVRGLDREALQKASEENVDLFGPDYQFEQIRNAIDGVRG